MVVSILLLELKHPEHLTLKEDRFALSLDSIDFILWFWVLLILGLC